MPADESIGVLTFGFEREEDDRIFARWLPYQDVIGYDDFKAGLVRKTVPKSNRAIMADVNSIIEASAEEYHGNI